ncbi:MAG: type II secretion system protein M [Alcanivoracaceae bacterium]|nr:type II secretion system protein M [Alcanivoracaceae bacterium]
MQWFNSLSSQEKKLIKFGSIIVTIALFWVFIYQPITQSIELKSKQKYELQDQYKQMQSSRKMLEKQKINAVNFHRDLNKPFISWIDEQLAKKQLTQFVTRSEPKDNKTVILTFESIVFDELAKWMQPLEVNYNVKISEVDIHLTDRSNGLCNARITLEENK